MNEKDFKDFYPSLKEKLLWEAIRFTNRDMSITGKKIEAIFHAGKSLLYSNDKPWFKKGESSFDARMGAYDGAEACELIGIFML